MNVSYPLSLKVSLWLMANLLLLAALGLGLLVVQGGLGWSALVAGPSGDRMQRLANVIAGEVSSAGTMEARNAVLARFGSAYDVDFSLFNFEQAQLAGKPVELPPEVKARMESFTRGGRGGDFRRGSGEGDGQRTSESGNRPPREGNERVSSGGDRPLPPITVPEKPAPPPETIRREGVAPPAAAATPAAGAAPAEFPAGRFVVRTGSPSTYWVGLRVYYQGTERPRTYPVRLIVRVESFWTLLHVLNLQSWVLAGGGVLALSVMFWLPLVRGITRSIGQLTAATEQIAEGNFTARVTAERRDEIGRLGDSVNRMAARLDAHMTGQKRFLGDVAHELCSPLARLQMASGILADQAPEKLQDTVSDLREEVQQMSTLVNELLAFTKAGLRPRDVALTSVPLAPLVQAVLAQEDATTRVGVIVPPTLQVRAEPDLLSRALANLVRNAIRYAGDAGPISLSAAREGERVVVAVEDSGAGVPPADLDRLGEPFFRPELARTRESGGVGLGLAIVRNSVTACGGEVRFSNRQPRGFRAEIRLAAS
jgi:two-component system, OmpR family, sensor histidine kinase CpxA